MTLADRRIAAPLVDSEVAVSAFMHGRLLAVPHARRTIVIPNAVDHRVYRRISLPSTGDATCFGWAGRMIAGKGLDSLLEGLSLAVSAGHPARLVLAGAGAERPRLVRRAAELGLASVVEFVGPVHDMPSFWNGCDVAVACSDGLTESFGMTVAEAAACGRPAIVARNGGLVEVVRDESTGLLVAPSSAADIAKAMSRYAADPKLVASHGTNAHDFVLKRFSLDGCADQYLRELSARAAVAQDCGVDE